MNMMPGTGLDTSLAGKEEMKIIELDWTHPKEGRRKLKEWKWIGHILRRKEEMKRTYSMDKSLGGKEDMKRMELDWTHPEEGGRKLKGWNWIGHILRRE